MVYTCCVIGCTSAGSVVGRKFFRFPMLDGHSANSMAKSRQRQQAWLKALKKPNFFECQFKYAKVCDLHFVSGRSAKLYDTSNVDWIPTLNLGYCGYFADERAVVVKMGSGEMFTIVDFDSASDTVRSEVKTMTDDVVKSCGDRCDSMDSGTKTQTYSKLNVRVTNRYQPYPTFSTNTVCKLRTTRATQTIPYEWESVGTQTGSKSFSTSGTQTDDDDKIRM